MAAEAAALLLSDDGRSIEPRSTNPARSSSLPLVDTAHDDEWPIEIVVFHRDDLVSPAEDCREGRTSGKCPKICAGRVEHVSQEISGHLGSTPDPNSAIGRHGEALHCWGDISISELSRGFLGRNAATEGTQTVTVGNLPGRKLQRRSNRREITRPDACRAIGFNDVN